MTSREFQERLGRRATRVGVPLTGDLGLRLEVYYRLLTAWNRKINLTGMNLEEGAPDVLDRLLVEPLVAARHCPTFVREMIDIGSGGGSPAIPFALALPGVKLRLVESKVRKSIFLREALRTLEIGKSMVEVARYEALAAREELHAAHDLLTVRAVRIEPRVLMTLQAFVRGSGQIFLFSSSTGREEQVVPPPLSWVATHPLIESQRSQLVVLEKLPISRG